MDLVSDHLRSRDRRGDVYAKKSPTPTPLLPIFPELGMSGGCKRSGSFTSINVRAADIIVVGERAPRTTGEVTLR